MSTLHLYPDGSVLGRPSSAGGGLAILHNMAWSFLAFSFDNTTNSDLAECKAILKALETAVSITTSPRHDITSVLLHMDSQSALILLNQRQNGEQRKYERVRDAVADGCFAAMLKLSAKHITVEADWVKGHAGEEGNEYADTLARYGARKCGTGIRDGKFEVDWGELEVIRNGRRVAEDEEYWMWEGGRREAKSANQQLSARMDGAELRRRELNGRWDAMKRKLDDAVKDDQERWMKYT